MNSEPVSPPRTAATSADQAKATLRMHEVAFNAITDMVSVLGEDEIYRLVNDTWCRAVGRERSTVIGRHVVDVFANGLDDSRRDAVRKCLSQNKPYTVKAPINMTGLLGKAFETTYSPFGLDDSGVRCVVVVSRDITEADNVKQALADSLENLRRTLNATGDGIVASDAANPDVPVRFVNQRALLIWGIPAELAPTLTPRQIVQYASQYFVDVQAEADRIQAIVDQRRNQEDVLTLRDGRIILRRCVATGDLASSLRVWSFRDVTAETHAQKNMRDTQSQMRAMLDAFPGNIAVLDHELVYRYVNARFTALTGKRADELLGKSVDDVLGLARGTEVRVLAARALQDGYVTFDRKVGDETIQVTMAGGLDPGTGKARYYGFGIDLTARKRAEDAVISARDEAERANLAKSQFLSHMSHELRTPLNAVMGFAQLLQDDAAEPLAATQHSYVEEILRGSRHLLRLINDVLDLGLVESGHLSVEAAPVLLAPLVQSCLHMVEPLARERGITLLALPQRSFEHTALADPTRLKQVLLNLLANAIKYNRVGGEVALHCVVKRDRVRVQVQDNGPGLNTEQQARLFMPFERLGSSSTNVEGAGIGLALSKRLMLAMSGDIGMQNHDGGGSTFWLELQRLTGKHSVAATADDPVAKLPAALPQVEQRRVLYIEDNDINTVLMQAMLARVPGLVLHCEAHPRAGLAHARQTLPDLILLDIQLPDMDGFAVLRELKKDPLTQHIPVVAVSANAMDADITQARGAGFFSYVTKPLELRVLLTAVQAALDHVASPQSPT